MSGTDSYVMLMASLPRSERLFLAKQPPISRLKLERRLKQLTADDREVLRQVETALDWREIDLGASDAVVLARATRALAALDSQTPGTSSKSGSSSGPALRRCAAGHAAKGRHQPGRDGASAAGSIGSRSAGGRRASASSASSPGSCRPTNCSASPTRWRWSG